MQWRSDAGLGGFASAQRGVDPPAPCYDAAVMRTTLRLLCPLSMIAIPIAGCRFAAPQPNSTHDPVRRTVKFPMDIHSHANAAAVTVRHASLDLDIHFAKKQLEGSVRLDLDRRDSAAPVVLDAHGLVIQRITGTDQTERNYELSAEDPLLGSALTVALAPGDTSIRIFYHTTEKSDALQWLDPAQTAGGRMPFLFSQGQSIFTRTWIPLQDSPSVRITYDAVVRAPEGFTTVMSARRGTPLPGNRTPFELDLPIPSYLIAIACGNLQFLPVSERSGVWAEPEIAPRARAEFEDTEDMIKIIERDFGKYRWGRYDILVLPPAFPFGGMENPLLTFATPTVLAGDKSLVSLVAHELAHSWSGNLVTNATWSDFWLNEGFTVYLENRIMEKLYGVDRAAMERQLARTELDREMASLEPKDQILHVDLSGRHPDDGFSLVPYEKGALFLRRVEEIVGRATLDTFLTQHFNDHAFQSITTEDFLKDLRVLLAAAQGTTSNSINIKRWVFEPGLPADAPVARSEALDTVGRAVAEFTNETHPSRLNTKGWVTQQWLRFLTTLPASAIAGRMESLDAEFKFTNSGNCEIVAEWLLLCIRNGYRAADGRLEDFLVSVGRRKYLKPLYTELAATPEGRARAVEIYKKARPGYHPIARQVVDKILQAG